jgi:hypothetical protein
VVEQPIRNRQVASSTLALGSNISFEKLALQNSVDWILVGRCNAVQVLSFCLARPMASCGLKFVANEESLSAPCLQSPVR